MAFDNSKIEVKEYLPSVWNDDSVMQGYMSMIKGRIVNPIDHDRKVKFWADLISSSCVFEHNALFSIELLKRRFRRGDQLPSSLSVVLDNMKRKGELISLNEWQEKHSNWVGWGVSRLTKTSAWLFGATNSSNTEKFIHIPTVEKQADLLLKLFSDEFQSEVDCTGEVVAYADFYDRAKNIVSTKENFDIILALMTDRGDVTVGEARSGEKILKFKDTYSDSPVRFTEADTSVHDIRRAMNKVEKEISVLEQKVKKLDVECRSALRSGEKIRAANFLRQKKRAEKDIADKDGQYQRLLTMLHQLGSTRHNKDVLDAYKAGTKAFKASLARHGLTPDKVDQAMDDVATSIDDYREIEEAMGQGVGIHKDNDELERELDELLDRNRKSAIPITPLPDVPSNTVGLGELDVDDTSINLERRLQRLRADAQ